MVRFFFYCMIEFLVSRPDGSSYISKRKAKIKVINRNFPFLCTGVRHATEVLNTILNEKVSHNDVQRGSEKLKELLEKNDVQIEFLNRDVLP